MKFILLELIYQISNKVMTQEFLVSFVFLQSQTFSAFASVFAFLSFFRMELVLVQVYRQASSFLIGRRFRRI